MLPHPLLAFWAFEKETLMMANRQNRPGLTLLELIVVLVILVAVAGIVIPLLPDAVLRSHTAVGATNTTEVDRIVQLYQRVYSAYPNDLDNLSGTSAIIDYLPGLGKGQISAVDVDPYVSTLKNAGITLVSQLHPDSATLKTNDGTPTFKPYTGTSQAVATGLKVAQLSEAAVEAGLVRDITGINGDVYLVFGLGKRCTAIGTVLGDAPVHFGKVTSSRAGYMYCRYGLIFRVVRGGATPTTLTEAQFMGAVSFQDDGIVATDGQLADFYDNLPK